MKSVMRAAWRLDAKADTARPRKLAEWLERKYPSPAASLLEGMENCFPLTGWTYPHRCIAARPRPTSLKAPTPGFACALDGFADGAMAGW